MLSGSFCFVFYVLLCSPTVPSRSACFFLYSHTVLRAPEFYRGCAPHLLAEELRLEKIGRVLKRFDICFLQEVQCFSHLVATFGDEYHVVSSLHREELWGPPNGERHGNCLLIRKAVCDDLVAEEMQLSADGNVALLCRARLVQAEQWVTLVNLHLECDDDVECITGSDFAERREAQIRAALSAVCDYGGPVFLAGVRCGARVARCVLDAELLSRTSTPLCIPRSWRLICETPCLLT